MKVTSYFPYFKLGIAYYQLGQWDAALQAFETEVRLEADRPLRGRPRRAPALPRARRRRQGRCRRERASARIRQIVDDSLTESRRLEAEGRFEEAAAALARALAVAPDDRDAQTRLDRLQRRVAS